MVRASDVLWAEGGGYSIQTEEQLRTWNRTVGKIVAPETKWLAPHIFYVGERA
jgi:hypothetical protein